MAGARKAVNAPRRIQLRRQKGWRLPTGAAKVDRTTRWGNPFRVGELHPGPAGEPVLVETASQAVGLFAELVKREGGFASTLRGATIWNSLDDIRSSLAGRDLACWCGADSACHADVLLAIANGFPPAAS